MPDSPLSPLFISVAEILVNAFTARTSHARAHVGTVLASSLGKALADC